MAIVIADQTGQILSLTGDIIWLALVLDFGQYFVLILKIELVIEPKIYRKLVASIDIVAGDHIMAPDIAAQFMVSQIS